MRPPKAALVIIGLITWWVLLRVMERVSMPIPLKVVAWIAGAVVALWTFLQAVEHFVDKYQRFGPGIHRAARGWWSSSPKLATLVVALICGLLAAIVAGLLFWYWAKQPSTVPTETDTERADVHMTEAALIIEHDKNRHLTATGFSLVTRNLGKRPAMNVSVRLWLGHDAKPSKTGPEAASYVVPVLEPGPYDPARNNALVYLSGASDVRERGPGRILFPPITIPKHGPMPSQLVSVPVPPPSGRPYLVCLIAFTDSLTKVKYTKEVCFTCERWPSGWSSMGSVGVSMTPYN